MLSITQHGSFSAAANALHTSQPALSNRIAILERELGAKVFDRNRYGVTLTEAGRILLRHAKAMDAVLLQAREEIELKKRGSEGPLAVGTTPVSAYELVPRALAQLARLRIVLSVVDDLDELLLNKLKTGELDVVVGTLDPRQDTLVQEKLTEFSFALVVSSANKLARRRSVSLHDLSGLQWALPPPGGAFRRYVEALFLNNGVPFPIDCWTFDSAASLKAAVQHTECVAVMPRHFIRVEERAGVLKALKLIDRSPARPIGIIYARFRPLSPIAERFRQALHDVAKSIR
jgi:DNA-binding transcriptional LysR family regulator